MVDLLNLFFNKNQINTNEKFVLAVSTGVDSTVLLDLFIKSNKVNNSNIIICHVNHHKRSQSEVEASFIKEYAKENSLKLYIKDLYFDELKDNFQSIARNKRYEFFKEVMDKEDAKYLVLAHHLDDLFETILLRIERGSSLNGYGGINECYEIEKSRYVIRPLITLSKDDIYKYAKDNKLKYFEDESNASNDYTRNKIRHDIIPVFKQSFPNILDKVYEYSLVLLNASSEVNRVRDEYIKKNVIKKEKEIILSKESLNTLSSYLKEEIIFELLKPFMLSKGNIEEIIKIIDTTKGSYQNIISAKFKLVIEYDKVVFDFNLDKGDGDTFKELVINDLGEYKLNDKLKVIVSQGSSNSFTNKSELWYNYDSLPIVIRSRIPGDRIYINGNYKKVKEVLIDAKIPSSKRDSLLLGVKDDEVLIIFGVRKSDILKNIRTNNICISMKEEE